MNRDLDNISRSLVDSAVVFTRLGLSVAGSAVGYAAEILKDVEHELKHAGERFRPVAEPAPAGEPEPPTEAAAK